MTVGVGSTAGCCFTTLRITFVPAAGLSVAGAAPSLT